MNSKVSIMTGNACDSNCVFCFAKGKSFFERSRVEIVADILKARGSFDEVEFTGGEFLVRKDAVALIGACRRAGFKNVSFGTNGKLLANSAFAEAVVKAGARKINFSLHGFKAETHDAITRCPGSYAKLLKGINNVAKSGAGYIWITFVITKSNYREMPALAAKFEKHKGVNSVVFTFVRPMEFFSPKEYAATVPRLPEIVPYLRKAAAFLKTDFHHIPPCVFEGGHTKGHSAGKVILAVARRGNPYLYKYLSEGMAFGSACKHCRRVSSCAGVWKTYLDVYGDRELRPFPVAK